MRLYNAKSCTPVGSNSMYVAPKVKKPSSESTLPARTISKSKHRGTLQQSRTAAAAAAAAASNSPILLSNNSDKKASIFNPFREDSNGHVGDELLHKFASRSSETSATDDLTPEFAAISKEFSSGSEAYDDFPTSPYYPEWPAFNRNIDDDEASDTHNTWTSDLTSSTLSTKFTATLFSNRVEVTVQPEKKEPDDEIQRAFSSSPTCFPSLKKELDFGDNQNKDNGPWNGAFDSPWSSREQFSEPSFDVKPFSAFSPPPKHKTSDNRKHVTFSSLPKDSFELEYDPVANGDDYVAVRNKLRRVKSAGRNAEQKFPPKHTIDQVKPEFASFASIADNAIFKFDLGAEEDRFAVNEWPLSERPKTPVPTEAFGREASSIPEPIACLPAKTTAQTPSLSTTSDADILSPPASRGFDQPTSPRPKTPSPTVCALNNMLGARESTCVTSTDLKQIKASDTRLVAAHGKAPSSSRKAVSEMLIKRSPVPATKTVTPKHDVSNADSPSSFFATLQNQLGDFQKSKGLRQTGGRSGSRSPPSRSGRVMLSDTGLSQLSMAEHHQKPRSGTTANSANINAKTLCSAKDFDLSKYHKMQKLGLPIGAVKNAMQRDGIDPALLDGKVTDTETSHADPDLSKYHKMLKLGLPEGAVRNAMERDGVNPCLCLDGSASGQHETHTNQPKDPYRRTRVHWETHCVVRNNTVWAMVGRDPDVSGLRVDQEEFDTLFRAEAKRQSPKKAQSTALADTGAVKLIDPKRANNGGIILSRIKLSYDDIAAAVNSLDEHAFTQEQTAGIIQYLPTTEERKTLIAFLNRDSNANVDSLCECEKFMVAMLGVRRAKRKLSALLFMHRFGPCLEEIRHDARVLYKACDEIMSSSGLRKILGIVLSLGNRLNAAGSTNKGTADAITLESLLKLKEVKAFDKKTSLLQWMVSVARRNNASLVHFKDELTSVFAAKSIQWDQVLAELRKVQSQLASVRKLALHFSREQCLAPLSASEFSEVDSSTLRSHLSVAKEEETAVLRTTPIGMFTLDASVQMAAIVEEVENAKTAFNACLLYFGEEDRKLKPSDVFETLTTFCQDFETANSLIVKEEKAQIRHAKRESKSQGVSAAVTRHSGAGGLLGEIHGKVPGSMTPWRRRKHVY